MKKCLLMLLAVVLAVGCSPKITSSLSSRYQALSPDAEVVVLGLNDSKPENAEFLGHIKVGDTGFTMKNGNYDEVLKIAKEQARKAGGNVLKITEHKTPDLVSSIHRIKADVLRVDDISSIKENQDQLMLSSHPDYAVIYFYRHSGAGVIVNYDVHIGEKKVYRAKANTKAEVKIYDEGEFTIWAKTEAKEVLSLEIKKGCDYYIRCSVDMGILVGRPAFDRMPVESGKAEYESIEIE